MVCTDGLSCVLNLEGGGSEGRRRKTGKEEVKLVEGKGSVELDGMNEDGRKLW